MGLGGVETLKSDPKSQHSTLLADTPLPDLRPTGPIRPGRARTSSRPSVHDCDRSYAVSHRAWTGTGHALHQPGTGRRHTRLPAHNSRQSRVGSLPLDGPQGGPRRIALATTMGHFSPALVHCADWARAGTGPAPSPTLPAGSAARAAVAPAAAAATAELAADLVDRVAVQAGQAAGCRASARQLAAGGHWQDAGRLGRANRAVY